MEAQDNNSVPLTSRVSAWVFLTVLVALAFFAYPLGTFPPALRIGEKLVLFNLSFDISISGMILLGLLAIPVILFFRWRLPLYLLIGIGLFAAMLLYHVPDRLEFVDEYVSLIGYVTIPCAAIILTKAGYITLKRVSYVAFALWCQQMLLAYIALHRNNPTVGTPGNVNWMAAMLLMLTPWVLWTWHRIFSRVSHPVLRWILVILCWSPTLHILRKCQSRAAWFTIAVALPLGLVMMWLPRKKEKILYGGMVFLWVVAATIAGYRFIPGKLLSVIEQDVRMPLAVSTAVMIYRNPFGVGAGEFRKYFTSYRSKSSYHSRTVAADMTIHPHNEVLNVGGQLGLPALLGFLILLSPLARTAFNDRFQTLAQLSAFFMILMAMADMPLVQPPTSFLGFFALGLCWHGRVLEQPQSRKPWLIGIKATAAALALVAAFLVAGMDVYHDYYMRKGKLMKHIAKEHVGLVARATPEVRPKILEYIREHHEKAIAAFKKSITPLSSLKPSYEIGALALSTEKDTTEAEKYLDHVAEYDPNFAHLNLLLGRLSLKKRDFKKADVYFSRECQFFPRSTEAWQNLYNFAMATHTYERTIAFEALLRDIYMEKARLEHPRGKLKAIQSLFVKNVAEGKIDSAVGMADDLMVKINQKFIDPLFYELTKGQRWPSFFVSGKFNEIDYHKWYLRLKMHDKMVKEFRKLPAAPAELTEWFTDFIEIDPSVPIPLPPPAWQQRKANPRIAYWLFSLVCTINGDHCIILRNKQNQPVAAYVLAGDVSYVTKSPDGRLTAQKNISQITFHRVDLLKKTCTELSRDAFNKEFRWVPGKTVVFIPVEDFFLRNQILGTLIAPEKRFLPVRPPTSRMIEIFDITATPAPPLPVLSQFCVRDHFNLYYQQIAKGEKQSGAGGN